MNELELIEIVFKPGRKSEVFKPVENTYNKWVKTHYLENCNTVKEMRLTACLLENQQLCNEQFPEHGDDKFLDIVAKVYPSLLANYIVSIQPINSPAGTICYHKVKPNNEVTVESEPTLSRTRKFKAPRTEPIDVNDVSKQLIEEIDNEIITDIKNNVGAVCVKESPSQAGFYGAISQLSSIVHSKALNPTNWIIVGTELYEQYKVMIDTFKISHKVFVRELFSARTLLMGSNYPTYIYSPYIPLQKSPPSINPDLVSKPGYITRYAKKLVRDGSKAYGKLIIQ